VPSIRPGGETEPASRTTAAETMLQGIINRHWIPSAAGDLGRNGVPVATVRFATARRPGSESANGKLARQGRTLARPYLLYRFYRSPERFRFAPTRHLR
jgi:hypothetical protein